MSDPAYEFSDLSDPRGRRGSAPQGAFADPPRPRFSRSATTPLAPMQRQPLEPIHETEQMYEGEQLYDSPPSPTGSMGSTGSSSSISLAEVGAEVVAVADNGSMLARFGKQTFYWMQTVGAVTSLVGAGIRGASSATESAGDYVQGVGGLMTAIGTAYTSYETARDAMRQGQVDPETGLAAQQIHRLKTATSKPAVEVAADLVSFTGGTVTAVASLVQGRPDIAFAGTLVNATAAAIKGFNERRGEPDVGGAEFLIANRQKIMALENWTRLPAKVQRPLTEYFSKVDQKADRKRAAAMQSHAGAGRPTTGRSSSVSLPSGSGYRYQQDPQAGLTELTRRNSQGGQGRRGSRG
ncbi:MULTISPECIES: hypothetical protein [Micromonospora]|uniref:Uncharacterized protein n=2 Tax=Micromonospora TaxID=1873 RepID=A0A9X0I019_9ACTN|nr:MULTISPECIES: hypothetical protein [Micromonospora]AEB44809.1 hypothetical protein VAB18032_18535 [Micromonospora maris AB-18-032]AIS85879.1 hypothetical protein VASRM7_637 [Verrucosispora sp. MS100047]KUJ44283.1 hypothetical protein ADL17_13765 [Micromonospora maris]RUL92126.1 hypothetical protein EG812_15745 [Verrucosispora sp. FIM060022]